MKITFSNLFLSLFIATTILVSACKKPKDPTEDTIPEISRKVYVLNEGSFSNSNSSVSIFDLSQSNMFNGMFSNANDRPLGDVLNSMKVINDKAYFVVNNSDKIEYTEKFPLSSLGVINGLSEPRYIQEVSPTKAYVSEHISFGNSIGRLSIIDLTTNTITSTINVGPSPEGMHYENGKLFVCISGSNNVIVVNTSNDAIESTITVVGRPTNFVKDVNNKLWLICRGNIAYDALWNEDEANSVAGALVRIDPSASSVEQTYTFSNSLGDPSKLTINGAKNILYFTYANALYSFGIGDANLPTTPFINRRFYGVGVDPLTNIVYTGTFGFTSNEKMIRYTSAGAPIDSFSVGIGPNGFVFE